ncbi:MAG: response regulator receiver modulated metal dependent phosphohydrolase [uncultured bacterium]|nr:MAG: response regulator receiver modulated metal dependent phosphohydrolase [uncultured bacterium]HBH18179.1 hypothetical protein [Cyanobacteria bacterium UBA9579]
MNAKEADGGNLSNDLRIIENDPMEAIFALNLGDFLTEHLISEDLLSKINTSFHDKVTGLKNQLKELISIYSLDKTLTLLGFDSEDDFVIYNSIAKTVTQMLGIDACHVYLSADNIKGSLAEQHWDLVLVGSSTDQLESSKFKTVGYSLQEKISIPVESYLTGQTFYVKEIKKIESWKPQLALNEDSAETLLVVPMGSSFDCIGVLCLEHNSVKDISPEHIELIEITAKLFVTSMRLQQLVDEAQTVIQDKGASPVELTHLRTELTASIGDLGDEQQMFVEALAKAVDAKSEYTQEHSRKVANLAKEISEYLHLNEKTTDLIYYAGLLQNIGKITLPEDLFVKKGKLTKADWNKLQNHPNVGVSLLMKINFLSEVVPYIHYHRERWDGQGEPEGLAGISIPLGSRIIAVADAYQALRSERAYRESSSKEQALVVMKQEAGVKWDPIIIDALLAISS